MRFIIFILCIGYLLVLFIMLVDVCEMKMDEYSLLIKVFYKLVDVYEEKCSSLFSFKY